MAPRQLAAGPTRAWARAFHFRSVVDWKERLAGEFAETVRRERGAVRYAGSGGSATATALSAVHEMLDTSVPTLLVLDDLDTAGPVVVEALSASVEELFDNPVLILALLRDPGTSPEWSAAVEKADERGDAHRVLAPLDVEGVREIVRLYVGDDVTDAPIESMARASAGLPGRVHERANEWAHSEASRRLGAAAAFLAASRDRHASDLKFVDNVIGMKLSRLYSVADHDQISAECPYKGLATFEAGDSANFFGRERLVGELAARIVQVGLLGVVGASGSGKSSVLAAGLLPSLPRACFPEASAGPRSPCGRASIQWSHSARRCPRPRRLPSPTVACPPFSRRSRTKAVSCS